MIAFLMLCVFICAGADEAKEIKTGITFSGNGKSEDFPYMQDDNFKTYYPLKEKKGWLEVHSKEPVHGIYVMLFERNTVPLEYDGSVINAHITAYRGNESLTWETGCNIVSEGTVLDELITVLR